MRFAIDILAIYLAILLLLPHQADANNTSTDYYRMPVNHEVRISGNFCELRTNHFHAGIDIRSSKGVVGDTVFSVAPGNLSRVRVQRSSYGQVLYIDHDNGTTSVYAHLDSFHPKIERLLKQYQYSIESTEIDLYLDSTLLKIKKGDYIGIMGNTGRSTGPHLHFEIRDTKSEEPINPYLFGFAKKDDIKPTIKSAWLHELDSLGRFKKRWKIQFKNDGSGNYKANSLIYTSSQYNGLAVGAFDKANGWHNYTGFYEVSLKHNNDSICSIINKRFNFNENRSINSLIDYGLYKEARTKVVKLYEQQHVKQSIYSHCNHKGIIELKENVAHPMEVLVTDYNGNTRSLAISLKLRDGFNTLTKKTNTENKTILSSPFIDIGKLDEQLFEDEFIDLAKDGQSYVIGSSKIPLNGYIPVKIKKGKVTENSILIKANSNKSFGGKVKDGVLYTSINEFGRFLISEDTQGPKIKTIRFSKNRSKYAIWKFLITDNFSDRVQDKSLSIQAHIDGKFIRSYFDSKSNTLMIKDLEKIGQNSNKLFIVATDVHDNSTTREYSLK